MTETLALYHGTYTTDMVLHQGLCLADDWGAASRYADQYRDCGDDTPAVHTVELDLTGLTVVELPQSWDSQPETAGQDAARFADADSDAYPDVDVLVYTDHALGLDQMTTYRLLTDRALAQVTITGSEEL